MISEALCSSAQLSQEKEDLAEKLGLLIDCATNFAIYMLDPHGLVTIWNHGAERIKGWKKAEVVGADSAIFYPWDAVLVGKPQADLTIARLSGQLEEASWQLRKDGTEFLAHVTITALRDDGGALRGFGKVVRDITDQIGSDNAMRRREQHLLSILASVPGAMIVFNEEGVISSVSTAAERLFGYKEQDLIGASLAKLFPQCRGRHCAPIEHVVVEPGVGQAVRAPTIEDAVRKNGEMFPIEFTVGEASFAGDRIFTGLIFDLTSLWETERRVRELHAELAHASRISAVGTMASTLAHEINQPLTAISNCLETSRALVADSVDPMLAELAQTLALAAADLVRAKAIVRRLRTFVDARDTEVGIERLDALIEDATSLGLLGAREAGITVTMTIAAGRARVRVDRIQIQQVLVNLIRNAIASMSASPRRELCILTACDAEGWTKVTVEDSGTGIDPELRERLRNGLATAQDRRRAVDLHICRTIVEAHGGRIWAEAGRAGGTAFHFRVPVAAERND